MSSLRDLSVFASLRRDLLWRGQRDVGGARRADSAIGFWASAAEGHASQLFPKPLGFRWVCRPLETIGQGKKLGLALLMRSDAVADEVHECTILAGPARIGDVVNLARNLVRKTN